MPPRDSAPLLARIRPEAAGAPESGIVEVANYGRGRPGLIPLWVGEGDLATPDFICEAAARAMSGGETFYTWQRGIPDLREAIARYHERLFGRPFSPDRFFVTVGGMHAAQIATRIVAGTGDEMIIPTPAWPNFDGAASVAGATPVHVPLDFGQGGWRLDLDRLRAAVTPRTRAVVVNSPANPTGWTATLDDLRAILSLARQHGLWIVSDEIYGRFVYPDAVEGGRAPSFHDVMDDDDRVLFLQTFSKNWAMTGWRIGWLEAPAALGDTIENLVQYSTSGVASFIQRAAVAALDEGEPFVAEQIARATAGRAIICEGLRATGLVDLALPPGAFYAYFGVRGVGDTRRLALRLVDEANVGVAPGSAFGRGEAQGIRLCFLRRQDDLVEAVARLGPALRRIVDESLSA